MTDLNASKPAQELSSLPQLGAPPTDDASLSLHREPSWAPVMHSLMKSVSKHAPQNNPPPSNTTTSVPQFDTQNASNASKDWTQMMLLAAEGPSDAANNNTATTIAQQVVQLQGTPAALPPPPHLSIAPSVTPASVPTTNDTTGAPHMYPQNIRPMRFEEKQALVTAITKLNSEELRGLISVIGKYQPDVVQQLGEEYDFDLGQMQENTVWAINDYVMLHSARKKILNEKFQKQVELYTNRKSSKGRTALKQNRSRPTPSKRHQCPTCKKLFRGKSELQNHIRTHTGEKPLVCSFAGCGKRYAHSSNLRAHERTHRGIKPYKCHYDGCGKSFAHSVSLKEHIWMHAGVKPYTCDVQGCGRSFTQISNFQRHKKLHERKNAEEVLQAATELERSDSNSMVATSSGTAEIRK